MSESRAEGSHVARRAVFGRSEAVAWAGLIVLSLISLHGVAVLLGLIMLIVPGLLLLLFPNLLMVLVLIQPARWVWRRSRILASPVAAMSLSVLGIIPAISNARLYPAVVAEQTGDFDHATPEPVRSLLLLGGSGLDCDETCRRLLDAGVPTVAVGVLSRSQDGGEDADLSAGFAGPTARYELGDEGDCKACILRSDGPGGKADLILSTPRQDRGPDRGYHGAAARYNPFDHGAFVVRRTDAWACTGGAACRQTLRSTSVSYETLWPVLVLGIDSASFNLRMWRGWQRTPRTAGEGDLAVLGGRLVAVTPADEPTSRRVQASLDGVTRELSLAAAEDREPVVPTLGEILQPWSETETPLRADQIAFLRMLVRHPTLEQIPFNWSAHPEVAVQLAPDLARALEQSKGRPAFSQAVQRALVTLPPETFLSLKAPILRWLRNAPSYRDRFEATAANDFVLRLAELGPDFARVAAARAAPRQGWPETAAMTQALCRLGPQGRPALAALKIEQAAIVEKRYQRNAPLEQAITSIEDGSVDKDDCYRGR
jgi:hypothetical protein